MHNTRVTSSDVAATHSRFNTVAQQLRFVIAYREQNPEYAPVSSRTPRPAGADRPDGRQRRPVGAGCHYGDVPLLRRSAHPRRGRALPGLTRRAKAVGSSGCCGSSRAARLGCCWRQVRHSWTIIQPLP